MNRYLFVCLLFAALHGHAQTKSIDTTETVSIGGIQQFITIKGVDRTNPILLFLHGGPGSSVMANAAKFTSRLQQHFTVVQWDQRETGKTQKLNTTAVPLTADLMIEDTHELIIYLLRHFGQSKLYLAGHSWGTFLGFGIAAKYPQLLYAWIAISPMIDQTASEKITLGILKEDAATKHNGKALEELNKVEIPFGNWEQLYYTRKWLFEYTGQPIGNANGFKRFFSTWAGIWLSVWNEAVSKDLFRDLPEISCPVYFLAGTKDIQTHFSIAETYYQQLKAPKKNFFRFENSGHVLPDSDPAMIQEVIIQRILAETDMRNP